MMSSRVHALSCSSPSCAASATTTGTGWVFRPAGLPPAACVQSAAGGGGGARAWHDPRTAVARAVTGGDRTSRTNITILVSRRIDTPSYDRDLRQRLAT